jgi:hypothetical protein
VAKKKDSLKKPITKQRLLLYSNKCRLCFLIFSGSNLITAANFCLQGRFAVVGTYDGRCIFYETEVSLFAKFFSS